MSETLFAFLTYLRCRGDGAGACVALDGEGEVGERQALEGDQLPGYAGVGSVDEGLPRA